MSNLLATTPEYRLAHAEAVRKLPMRLLFAFLYCAVLLAILIGVSGEIRWTAAWLLSAAYFADTAFYLIWGTARAPELLQERARPKKNAKRWDLILMRGVYLPLFVSLLVVSALDRRFGWSWVSPALRVAAGGAALASCVWITWVLYTNRFASGVVRIQADRGQTVVSTGPYRVVRHPMYLGNVFLFAGMPLILGSWFGLLLSASISAVFVLRITLEDKTLHDELEGYREYAQRVRYRLIPGIW